MTSINKTPLRLAQLYLLYFIPLFLLKLNDKKRDSSQNCGISSKNTEKLGWKKSNSRDEIK